MPPTFSAPLLNPDVLDTSTPPIPAAKAWALAYDGGMGPLVDLSQAVPGMAPPDALLTALGARAGSAEAATYGAITGDTGLRAAYAADFEQVYQHRPGLDEIAITSGCNQAFVVTVMALARHGDNIILPAPWYFNHQMTLQMLGIEARALPCHGMNGFIPQVKDASPLIDARTRAIVLVTPNNPTGAVYPPETMMAFAELARQSRIHLVLDETYRDFMPGEEGAPHDLFTKANWQHGLIQLYSFSKAYAIPGWRLGAVVAGSHVIHEIGKWLDCIQISPVRAGQMALAETLHALAPWRETNRRTINQRASLFRKVMAGAPEWHVESCGAYFAYLRHPFVGVEAAHVTEKLARERGVLALPGTCFGPGQPQHLRIAIANVQDGLLALLPSRLSGFTA